MNKFLFTYSDEEIKQIVRRCYGRMKAYIMKMASLSSDDADDILQDTLLKLLEKQPSVLKSKIDGYLFRMVRNACVNFRTRGGAQQDRQPGQDGNGCCPEPAFRA